MACGCSGSTPNQAAAPPRAGVQRQAAPTGPRGPNAPGYYFTGPQKREQQQGARRPR